MQMPPLIERESEQRGGGEDTEIGVAWEKARLHVTLNLITGHVESLSSMDKISN